MLGFSCLDGCDGQLPRTIFYLFFHLFCHDSHICRVLRHGICTLSAGSISMSQFKFNELEPAGRFPLTLISSVQVAGTGTVIRVHSGKHRVEGYPGAGSIVRLEAARWTRIKGGLLDG